MHSGFELIQKALKPIHQGGDFHSVTDSELNESVSSYTPASSSVK